MEIVNVHDAKTHLSRLLEQVCTGKEIVIARAGKPVARLVPFKAARPVRKPGSMKGRLKVPDDFNEALPADVLALFEADNLCL
ncbi:MAG: type II toxin-antitoxin system Phd/YefM family antitoxin [Candidatus Xenobia bacterium]